MISAARREDIVSALRRGTVPSSGLDALAVGIEDFAPTLDEELAAVSAGRGGFKAVRGEYGTGKTFFGRWLQERARTRGFAATEVQINETETPLHRLETVYRRLVEHLGTADTAIDVGDLDRVIQIDSPSSVSSFLQRMGRTGRRAGGQRNCLFLTTNDNAFLLALGVTQKWSEAWVEAAVPPAEPWNIVAQQAMVLLLERGELATRDLIQLLQRSFPELQIADIEVLVEHMVEQQFLDRAEGVVRVGPQTEHNYARGHYRELLASFSGSQLLTGRHGAAEVGYIDPTVLSGERDERLILLAGRSWRVTDIDWSKRIVWLEPAAGGGKARWMGGARSLGRDVCQGIRSVLANGASPTITLSRRAQAALQMLTDEISMSPGTHFVTSRTETMPVQTWTFAGTRANRTLARSASFGGAKVRFDALSVQAPVAALPTALPESLSLTDDELAAFRDSIKFADCVPRQLLSRTILARNFEAC